MKFSLGHPATGIPVAAERATVVCVYHSIWLTGHSPTAVLDDPSLVPDTLSLHLLKVVPDTSWAIQQVLFDDEGSAIAAAIRAGTCISVSDGSFKDQHGTAAWVIEAESSTHRCTGVNNTPGAPSDQSAYRSEVSELFGIATMIRELCKFHHVLTGTVQIGWV
jgi:hypothetical protein